MTVRIECYTHFLETAVEWRTNKDEIEYEYITESAARYHSAYDYTASGQGYA